MNHLSLRIAVGAALVYAVVAILFNLSNSLIVLVVGPTSELYGSTLWTLKNLAVSTVVLIAVLVGSVASITALVRHRDTRLVAFLSLTLCAVGLSVRLLDVSQFLTQRLHGG